MQNRGIPYFISKACENEIEYVREALLTTMIQEFSVSVDTLACSFQGENVDAFFDKCRVFDNEIRQICNDLLMIEEQIKKTSKKNYEYPEKER